MKIIFSFAVFIIIACNSFAQTQKRLEEPLRHGVQTQQKFDEAMLNSILDAPGMPLTEVKKYIGSDIYIYDTIKGYKVINDTLKLLFIGENYPKHILTILVSGTKINRETMFKVGQKSRFTGKAFIYNGKPAITITNPSQLNRHIIF